MGVQAPAPPERAKPVDIPLYARAGLYGEVPAFAVKGKSDHPSRFQLSRSRS